MSHLRLKYQTIEKEKTRCLAKTFDENGWGTTALEGPKLGDGVMVMW